MTNHGTLITKILTASALVLALLTGSMAFAPERASAPHNPKESAPVAQNLIISGACIRFTANGPRWHTNTAHHAVGLIDTSREPIINASGWLEFYLVDENGDPNPHPVVSMTIASDETLATNGIFGGASSGTTEVRVRFSKSGVNGADRLPLNLNNSVHYDRISGPNSNVWVTLVHHAE